MANTYPISWMKKPEMTDNLVKLQKITDMRGSIVVLEEGRELPFSVRRCYYIYDTKPDQPRGAHAHKALEQVCICVSGSCDIVLDDGKRKTEIHMNDPATGVYVGPMVWREMRNFSNDCVFLVLASHPYDEDDYIRDYHEFLKRAGK